MQELVMDYKIDQKNFKALVYSKDSTAKPSILLASTFAGHSPFIKQKAQAFAQMGFTAIVVDMYGDGKFSTNPQECNQWMSELLENRPTVSKRMRAALDFARQCPQVDSENVAAIGYCFGGLCVLDLARSGADVKAVVSLHGLLQAPTKTEKILSRVLVLHGYEDPLARPHEILEFSKEMALAEADWQFHIFGNAAHAFTNPTAQNKAGGMQYNESANRRSEKILNDFLAEAFA